MKVQTMKVNREAAAEQARASSLRVLMTDDLSKIVNARAIARRAYKKWEIGSEVIR